MGERNSSPELPQGWTWTTIGEIAATSSGGTPSRGSADYYGGSIPWVKSGELKDGAIFRTEEFITELGLRSSSAKIFPAGTLCIALYGATVGKLGVLGIDAATNQAVCGIFVPPLLETQYLFHFLYWQRRNLIELGKGGAQPNISQDIVRRTGIPLPPLSEQQRIVAKIEELFTKLDAGVDALKKARAQLGRYRQAVLKAAVTGELTREWRDSHKGELEPAADLLARILRERRAKWEAGQLAKMQAAGKPPKNDDWKQKYQEPIAPDASELPELPECWTWTTVEQLASFAANSITDGPFGSNLKSTHYTESGPRVIRLQNIGDGKFVDEHAHISEEHFQSLVKHQIFAGDIVIASLGEVAPRSCIIPEFIGAAIVKADCIRFNSNTDLAIAEYINYALNSDPTRKRTMQAIHGVGRPRLGLGGIRQIALPLPPLADQQQIVSEVERLLSIADAMEQTIEQSLRQATRLRQSILQQAFAGKLVPQDPNDEPASRLLERIREERAREAEAPKQKRKSSKHKPPTQTAFFT